VAIFDTTNFSELAREPFLALLRSLEVLRLEDGALVTRQGDPGDALFLVASGEVRVFVSDGQAERDVARLRARAKQGALGTLENLDALEIRRIDIQVAVGELP